MRYKIVSLDSILSYKRSISNAANGVRSLIIAEIGLFWYRVPYRSAETKGEPFWLTHNL